MRPAPRYANDKVIIPQALLAGLLRLIDRLPASTTDASPRPERLQVRTWAAENRTRYSIAEARVLSRVIDGFGGFDEVDALAANPEDAETINSVGEQLDTLLEALAHVTRTVHDRGAATWKPRE